MAHSESENYMSVNQPAFLGSKNIGKGTGQANQVAMSWAMGAASETSTGFVPMPFVANLIPIAEFDSDTFEGLLYEIDPVVNQGSFTFGESVAMQVSITRPKANQPTTTTTGQDYYMPGRVIIYCTTTGQIWTFGPREVAAAAYPTAPLSEHDVNVLPLYIAQGGKLQVWMEQDINSGTVTGPASAVNITLFNFPISPVGVSQ